VAPVLRGRCDQLRKVKALERVSDFNLAGARDMSSFGGWRAFLAQQQATA
jgi:hypothetical protein